VWMFIIRLYNRKCYLVNYNYCCSIISVESRLMRSRRCLCVTCPLNVARQRLGKHLPAAKNTHATAEEMLDAVFSTWPVSYQIFIM
jgi:hypothetical protein